MTHPTSPATQPKSPRPRPKVLFLTYISPRQQWGSAQRSRHLLEALSQRASVEVLVLNFFPHPAPAGAECEQYLLDGIPVRELHIQTRGLTGRPRFDLRSRHVTDQVSKHVKLADHDLIVSRYVRPALKLHLPPDVPVLVDFDDVSYQPPWHALRTPKMWVGAMLRLFNDRLIVRGKLRRARFQHAHYFFCNADERAVFPHLPGSLLPNLPAAPKRAGPPDFNPPSRPALMFIGLLDYMPNTDAVDWMLSDIWPLVLKRVPDAQLLVVGKGSEHTLSRWAAQPGVRVLGFVESLESAYAQATASVVPMRSGGGTNIKALEAYLYGRPIVATSHVAKGHGDLFTPGEHLLVADSPEAFAAHCVLLLSAPDRAEALARAGHQRISERLSPQHFQRSVQEVAQRLLPASAVATAPSPVAPPLATPMLTEPK